MYIPPAFNVEAKAEIADFIHSHSFATLITHSGEAPFASHLPMLFHPEDDGQGMLISHMARANPQWQHFDAGAEVLAIFHGPHSYISPSWYQVEPAVPTWNYAVVHAYGVPAILEDHDRVIALLNETISRYESAFENPWPGDIPEDYRDKLIKGIVAFEMPISRMECKFKLSQNRPTEDSNGAIEALSKSSDPQSKAVAQMMSDLLTAAER